MGKFNVKTTDRKTIEVEGKLVKIAPPNTPPTWFRDFEKRIDKRFDKQEQFNNKVIERFDNLENKVGNLEKRFDNVVSKNNLKE